MGLVLVLTAGIFLSGCSSVQYLYQAAKGQLMLSNRSRPIADVLNDPRTPPRIVRLLSEVDQIKKFGESQGLRPTQNYTHFVQLDKPAVVTVVTACEELQFTAKEWSFPIVGSFNYLGWFDHEAALKHAQSLRSEGWDVDVRGASAFSTLGWFRDPVLSSMIPEGDSALGALVNVILHESIHASLYIKGQSSFNESIASFAADVLTPNYLKNNGEELKAYLESEKRGELIRSKFHEAYLDLEKIYNGTKDLEHRKSAKSARLQRLKDETRYGREINNATLIQFKTYDVGRVDFEKMFERCQKEWPRFWTAIQKIDEKSFPQPQMTRFADILDKIKC